MESNSKKVIVDKVELYNTVDRNPVNIDSFKGTCHSAHVTRLPGKNSTDTCFIDAKTKGNFYEKTLLNNFLIVTVTLLPIETL